METKGSKYDSSESILLKYSELFEKAVYDILFEMLDEETASARDAAERLKQIIEAEKEGRLVILPSESEEIVNAIEVALGLKLYDWQKAYMFGCGGYLAPGRQTGKTLAWILKILLSEGPPLHLYNPAVLREVCDSTAHGSQYFIWFKNQLRKVYCTLLYDYCLRPKLRKIYFTEGEARNDEYSK